MKRRTALLLVFLLGGIGGHTRQLSAQPPRRLVADNRTPSAADIYAWNGAAWNFVMRLNPKSWTAFPNAAQGSLWRAMIGQTSHDHRVQYSYDPGYGGYQSVWLIQ